MTRQKSFQSMVSEILASGVKQEHLARAAGLKQHTISRIYHGKTKMPKYETGVAIESFYREFSEGNKKLMTVKCQAKRV